MGSKMTLIYTREDGYKVYQAKGMDVGFWKGTYIVLDWIRDNEFKTKAEVIKAID